MNNHKILSLTLLTPLFVLAGCTQTQITNTNADETANENTNVEVAVNTNTNIDTSDWLTYTNEEYGFSFKYPVDWEVKDTLNDNSAEGTIVYLGIRPRSMKEDSLYSFRISTNSIDEEINNLSIINDPITQVSGPFETVIVEYNAQRIEVKNTFNGIISNDYFVNLNDYTYLIFGQQDEVYDTFLTTLQL